MANSFKIDGMKELERSIRRLGALPQKCVTKAAKAGAKIAQKAAIKNAPYKKGNLRRGIILQGEKRKIGKKVYDIMINPEMNDIFAKVSKSGKRSYYPASMESKFRTVNGRVIEGKHYLLKALTQNAPAIEQKMVDVLSKEIDKELGKG